MQEELHQNPNCGVASMHYAPIVVEVLKQVRVSEWVDYDNYDYDIRTRPSFTGL